MEGSGFDQRYRLSGVARPEAPRRRRIGASARLLVVVLLAAAGVASVTGAFAGLSVTVYRGVGLLRQSGTTAQTQRFAFDRLAWRALAVDDVFPPVHQTTTAAPMQGVERDFTRIGVAPMADCRAAFEPAVLRLLGSSACGPVLRAGYTDASRSLVATVGIAFLGTNAAAERAVGRATEGERSDLRPHAVAFPGTAAAGFGDSQRMAFRVFASPDAPYLTFAVVGFSDGRPAVADPGTDAVKQSGAQLAVVDLAEMLDRRVGQATDALWAGSG